MSPHKTVYVPFSSDFIHHGHLNIIKEAKKHGHVIVGLLTDKAIAEYKRVPLLSFIQRQIIIENIKGVDEVVPQDTWDFTINLLKIKPDYFVHGDDWKEGIQKPMREKVLSLLEQWGGKLIEPQYTRDISSSQISRLIEEAGTTPQSRRRRLRQLLEAKPIVRILEAHNGLTGLIVEKTKVTINDRPKEFDGIWISSLTDSTAKGKPDIELSPRIDTIEEILEVTSKPIIVDGDTGGLPEHFPYTVKTLERLGVSGVIIEDKIGFKQNSLFGTDVIQKQDSIKDFSHKITLGKKAQVTNDFMVIARIESLILKQGLEDALSRAKSYIKAGVDAIMIHSKEKEPNEIVDFCEAYKDFEYRVPLVVVPTTYNKITEDELIQLGVSIVIYGNHLIRSAYPAMVSTAESILTHNRCHEASMEYCMSVKEIITLIPRLE
jgi:phosphoenolpyruvate phosphomutase / 2-hydroxyethylphosphonate cytidylyltransferase